MKRFYALSYLLVVAILAIASVVQANPVDQGTARQVGTLFVSANTQTMLKGPQDLQLAKTYSIGRGDAAFHVFNTPSGFVIVAADDCATPILGYSDEGRPFDPDHVPVQLQDLLQEYVEQIQYAVENNLQPDATTARQWQLVKTTGRLNNNRDNTQVGPLLTTTWDQGQYYNAMCPEDPNGPDGHCVTGCVATAMAQIIKYHGFPVSGRGIHSYQSNYGELAVNFEDSEYDYTNMPNALTNESTDAQVNAVAKLISDCGVAVNMEYTAWESGAFDQEARAALINFFRYSPDLSFAEKAFFSTDDWNAILKTELDANRPIYYSGQGTGGHAFVCDGYNTDGYYHFNFGWSGNGNSWYCLDAVNPLGMDFNSSQSAILGILPDTNGNVILGQMQGNSTFTVDEPLEFYHIMGHNQYEGYYYTNPCNNTVNFSPADATDPVVVDIMEYEDQSVTINDGEGTWLRDLSGGENNDLSPVVSTVNGVSISYSGNLFYAGFKLSVSQDNGCRMVSNITSSIDATTVHLTWTENGGATQWQVEYGIKGFELGSGTVYNAATNTVTIENLEKFTEYDFYIRPVCDDNQFGLWNKRTIMVEAEYWQDVISSQPQGYAYHAETNTVEISTAEGFAWWARNGCNVDAYLTADIDLSDYKWRPTTINNKLDGLGHFISNVYIKENTQNVGLFSECQGDAIIDHVGLTGVYVKAHTSVSGGLCGTLRGMLRNCSIRNSFIDGADMTGGLVGSGSGTIIDCYVNADVIGNRWTGLLSGVFEGVVRNSYAAGSVSIRSYCYIAGIVAYAGQGEISNCYSVETPMGVVGYKGTAVISDTSSFVPSGMGGTLLTPIVFEETSETDLLAALNRGVEKYNDSTLCLWEADVNLMNDGFPVHGTKFTVQCPNVLNVSVQNMQSNNVDGVLVGWDETGDATQWRIRYRRHNNPDSNYEYITATSNPDTIFGIPQGYVYDFSVRSLCESDMMSGWSETRLHIVDLPYWTDIVTSQPPGFLEDANGNVEISSAEGLAWLAVTVNGFNGQTPHTYAGKTVKLTADIDLEGYRWYPIGRYINNEWKKFSGVFDGQEHVISNLYVNDAWSDLGLFGRVDNGRIRNVIIEGGSVSSIYTDETDAHSLKSSAVGGLIGYAEDCYEINNCHSSATIYANGGAGSLCGSIRGDQIQFMVSNCSASGTVYGRQACGGLIGDVYGTVEVRNCYAKGDVNIASGGVNAWYRGGLIGNFMFAKAVNCYSIGSVTNDSLSYGFYGKVIGCPYMNTHIHYVYSQDNINEGWGLTGNYCEDIADTAQFHHENGVNTLLTPVSIDSTSYSELLDALNAWVVFQNDPTLKTWIIDGLTGYPRYGDYYEPSCYNPTDLAVSQATIIGDTTIRTQLSWTQEGEPDHWEILYVATENSIDSGIIVQVSSNPCILTDIPTGHPLDFYIRAVCGDNDKSYWSDPVTYIPDKLRWTEVVTSQPEGYIGDADGNVYISSAEGLAWLSSVSNGLNGVQYDQYRFNNKKIVLTSDIDLSAYRWVAIGRDWACVMNGVQFIGNNHVITGLYCNELEDYQGLFGYLFGGDISNLIINQCDVYGEIRTGAIAGYALYSDFVNCAAVGNVYGIEEVGGIVGRHDGNNSIKNSYFVGVATMRRDMTKVNTYGGYIGGICGVPIDDTIVNCYVVSEIVDSVAYPGIITGIGGRPGLVSNCYYKYYETTLPITSGNCNTTNNSSFSGSGTTWTLNSPPYVNGEFHSDLLDALNAWVDANNAESQYLHWVADTANVNGGFPVLERQPSAMLQLTDLTSGWNWYSTYIELDGAEGLVRIENALGGNAESINSQTAFTRYYGEYGWYGSLNSINNESMYRFKMSNPTVMTMVGMMADPASHPITLSKGWNHIGFLSASPMEVSAAFSGLEASAGDMVKNQTRYANYYEGYGWYGSLTQGLINPGDGLMYKSVSDEAKTFTYPAVPSRGMSAKTAPESAHWIADAHAYPGNMTVLAVVELDGEELGSDGYELAVFANDGCRGSIRLSYVEPLQRHAAFLTVSGDGPEELRFALYDATTGETFVEAEEHLTFNQDGTVGEFDAPFVLHFRRNAANDEATVSALVYPNPTDGTLTVEAMAMTHVTVTNALGQVLYEADVHGDAMRLDLGRYPAGMYLIRINTDNGTVVRKISLTE